MVDCGWLCCYLLCLHISTAEVNSQGRLGTDYLIFRSKRVTDKASTPSVLVWKLVGSEMIVWGLKGPGHTASNERSLNFRHGSAMCLKGSQTEMKMGDLTLSGEIFVSGRSGFWWRQFLLGFYFLLFLPQSCS